MTNIDGSPLTPEQRARRAGFANWGFSGDQWLVPGSTKEVMSTAEVCELLDKLEREKAEQDGRGSE